MTNRNWSLKARLNVLPCPTDPGGYPDVAQSSYAGCHNGVEAQIDVDNDGVFFLNSAVGYRDITDGSSNTIFVGEKKITLGDLNWLSGTRSTLRNTGSTPNSLVVRGTPFRTQKPAEFADPTVVGGFGSWHTGGAQFALGDGSVRFLNENITLETYQHLGSRNDDNFVGEF
jgi:hypothetical protein